MSLSNIAALSLLRALTLVSARVRTTANTQFSLRQSVYIPQLLHRHRCLKYNRYGLPPYSAIKTDKTWEGMKELHLLCRPPMQIK